MSPELKFLLEESKKLVERMTPEERERMYAAQRDSWVRSEIQ